MFSFFFVVLILPTRFLVLLQMRVELINSTQQVLQFPTNRNIVIYTKNIVGYIYCEFTGLWCKATFLIGWLCAPILHTCAYLLRFFIELRCTHWILADELVALSSCFLKVHNMQLAGTVFQSIRSILCEIGDKYSVSLLFCYMLCDCVLNVVEILFIK